MTNLSELEVKEWLTPDDIKVVRSAIYEVRSKWFDIGLELGITVNTLESIKKDNDDVNSCFREMLVYWLKMVDPKPSWSTLIHALREPTIHENALADTLMQKFCPSASRRSKQREFG